PSDLDNRFQSVVGCEILSSQFAILMARLGVAVRGNSFDRIPPGCDEASVSAPPAHFFTFLGHRLWRRRLWRRRHGRRWPRNTTNGAEGPLGDGNVFQPDQLVLDANSRRYKLQRLSQHNQWLHAIHLESNWDRREQHSVLGQWTITCDSVLLHSEGR